jgi:hypothetical protein
VVLDNAALTRLAWIDETLAGHTDFDGGKEEKPKDLSRRSPSARTATPWPREIVMASGFRPVSASQQVVRAAVSLQAASA